MVSSHKYIMQTQLTELTIGSAMSLETRDRQKRPKYEPRRYEQWASNRAYIIIYAILFPRLQTCCGTFIHAHSNALHPWDYPNGRSLIIGSLQQLL
jgi:hypothetical protein